MTKRFGFTLAEVLITLGIIGVVAAMTIPNLIANTNGAKFRSQFKKSVSTLSQAGLMSQAQYDFDYAGTTQVCATDKDTAAKEHPEALMSFCSILNGTLTGHTYQGTVTNIKRNVNGTMQPYSIVNAADGVLEAAGYTTYIAYSLADGSIFAFNKDAVGCEVPLGAQLNKDSFTATANEFNADGSLKTLGLKNCMGFIDVNGATLPNKEVTCSAVPTGGGTVDKASLNVDKPCTVKNDAKHMTDVFPVVIHDATVEPASDAAKYVLTSSK